MNDDTPVPEKDRDRLLRVALQLHMPKRNADDFLVEVDAISEERSEALRAAYMTHFTELLGRPPDVEEWYRFERLAAKRPIQGGKG